MATKGPASLVSLAIAGLALTRGSIAGGNFLHPLSAALMVGVVLASIAFADLVTKPGAATTAHRYLRESDARWLSIFSVVTFGGVVGLAGYLPIFFASRFGLSKGTAAACAAMCVAGGS